MDAAEKHRLSPHLGHARLSLSRALCLPGARESIDQVGDPVPRWVVHCQRLKPTVLLITGKGQVGKSSLARGLGRGQVVTVEIDLVLRRLVASMERADRPILQLLETIGDRPSKSYRKIVLDIEAAGLSAEFADLIFSHIPSMRMW